MGEAVPRVQPRRRGALPQCGALRRLGHAAHDRCAFSARLPACPPVHVPTALPHPRTRCPSAAGPCCRHAGPPRRRLAGRRDRDRHERPRRELRQAARDEPTAQERDLRGQRPHSPALGAFRGRPAWFERLAGGEEETGGGSRGPDIAFERWARCGRRFRRAGAASDRASLRTGQPRALSDAGYVSRRITQHGDLLPSAATRPTRSSSTTSPTPQPPPASSRTRAAISPRPPTLPS